MKPFARSDRVGELIQQVLSETLRRDINDPRLAMTTISGVKMSVDLRIAKIYYTAPNNLKQQQDVARGFGKASGFLKRALSKQLQLRYMPELKFFRDESFDYGSKIDKLLSSIQDTDGSDITDTQE